MSRAIQRTAGIHFSSYKDDDKESKAEVPEGTLVAGDDDGVAPDFAAVRAAQILQREQELLNG